MKKHIGILASVVYALLFRILVEFQLMEMNSWSYLIFVPILMGYLPFVLDKKTFIESKAKSILFPMISVVFVFGYCIHHSVRGIKLFRDSPAAVYDFFRVGQLGSALRIDKTYQRFK